jgi:hypothetical protein
MKFQFLEDHQWQFETPQHLLAFLRDYSAIYLDTSNVRLVSGIPTAQRSSMGASVVIRTR